MKTCIWVMNDETLCGEICEGRTKWCGSHNRQLRKEETENQKSLSKRATLIEKQKVKNQAPRKTISKNPKDWSNTFLCSDGTRVTQAEIDKNYLLVLDTPRNPVCEGCDSSRSVCRAHIIARARCKVIGKTELIWDYDNLFDACHACNLAIENPKGKAWKQLKNLDKCLSFIKLHDPELYTKFELSAVN